MASKVPLSRMMSKRRDGEGVYDRGEAALSEADAVRSRGPLRRSHSRKLTGVDSSSSSSSSSSPFSLLLSTVIHAQHGALPALVPQRKQQRAIPAAEIQKRRLLLRERLALWQNVLVVFCEGFEKGDDAGLGVGVVEPVCARVGGVGGVVCEFGCVEVVPADLSVSDTSGYKSYIRYIYRYIYIIDGIGVVVGFAYYSFVPSLEGGRYAGLLDDDVIVYAVYMAKRSKLNSS
jgi:hypothetical protein